MRRPLPSPPWALRPGAVSNQSRSMPGGRPRASARVIPSSGASKCRPVGVASAAGAPEGSTQRTASSTSGWEARWLAAAWAGFFLAVLAPLAESLVAAWWALLWVSRGFGSGCDAFAPEVWGDPLA